MRRIRYQVACSLDGYIAGPNGEYDWIVADPEIDFKALFTQFDTILMGRRTFDGLGPGAGMFGGMKIFVFSRTLDASKHKSVTIVRDNPAGVLDELKAKPGKDIWLFGGGELFRSLLDLGYVDTVEPAIVPILLGGGVPFLPAPALRKSLTLTGKRIYPSGIALLEYAVRKEGAGAGKATKAAKARKKKPSKS
jgi:dihydrofolate reductase